MKSLKTRIQKLEVVRKREMMVHMIEMVPGETAKQAIKRYTSEVRDILPNDTVRLHDRVNTPPNAGVGAM